MNDSADDNPYAPPTAEVNVPTPPAAAFIQKKFLVVPVGWQSPPVCILTGKTVDLLPHRKTVFWTNPWIVSIISAFSLYQIFKNNEIGCIV
ncbi:MAG: hypothetical protein EOO09_22755 [Chitinophagaceae bacterium]|nr:MAG: hypothetical protein EOO09_22755 [Chitinophagaceae bacterium]